MVVAALVAAAAVVTVTAVYTYRTASAPAPAPAPATMPPGSSAPPRPSPPQPVDLAAEFVEMARTLNATMGLAVTPVGAAQPVTTFGDWHSGPAWSTIKVPLVIAAYRQQGRVTEQMRAAIVASDNAAAEALWEHLGDPGAAALKVEQVLRETGDPTTVESRRLRKEFTAFGQTIWSLSDQVRFTANAFCNRANAPVFALMGEIEPQQSWGIGTMPGAQFKGGWGPSPAGKYLVRQLGIVGSSTGKVAVAIAAEPASGTFEDGRHALDAAATWLTSHLDQLPAGQCQESG